MGDKLIVFNSCIDIIHTNAKFLGSYKMKKCLYTETIKENTEVEHLSCSAYSFLYKNDFIKTKALILAKNLRTS